MTRTVNGVSALRTTHMQDAWRQAAQSTRALTDKEKEAVAALQSIHKAVTKTKGGDGQMGGKNKVYTGPRGGKFIMTKMGKRYI